MTLQGARILVGITGGIAAYKSISLIRALQKHGADVRAIATPSVKPFVGLETLRAITREEVPVDVFHQEGDAVADSWTRHIHWGEWADLYVIAPCTAQTMAKIAHGFSDNMLTASVLARRCPLMICPTMDGEMWDHPATQRNVELLRGDGIHILEPAEGYLASGLIGQGRLPEEAEIVAEVERLLADVERGRNAEEGDVATRSHGERGINNEAKRHGTGTPSLFAGKRVLITTGPTREYIDDVRFISNPSSGKMGIAMALAAKQAGAHVTLLHGPIESSLLPAMDVIDNFESADELFELVQEHGPEADVVIMAAAVSDAKPAKRIDGKVKKTDQESSLQLASTPDILAWLGGHKSEGQTLIGFAMESDAETAQASARAKMESKNLDAIILNLLREGESGFGIDSNNVELFVGQKTAQSQDKAQHQDQSLSQNYAKHHDPPFHFAGTKLDVALQLVDQLSVSLFTKSLAGERYSGESSSAVPSSNESHSGSPSTTRMSSTKKGS
ncbi:MAG: bifunctional phosphopantothenoylcysteine decarboxylase/phosphopantothenate synthase [Balneolaceae bacterium]|nr:bifunctional phosphopantothenoylcysteine decarboxylase/phosphopantothenate synthase [Balneolaceae bacterium]MDR9446965.1 bifunctional phosphopantothenoylcysteine decarboxylase/phosphopantothenate synthase [Balneolaceae bacterium]